MQFFSRCQWTAKFWRKTRSRNMFLVQLFIVWPVMKMHLKWKFESFYLRDVENNKICLQTLRIISLFINGLINASTASKKETQLTICIALRFAGNASWRYVKNIFKDSSLGRNKCLIPTFRMSKMIIKPFDGPRESRRESKIGNNCDVKLSQCQSKQRKKTYCHEESFACFIKNIIGCLRAR